MKKHLYYKTGVDISSTKSMYNFLKNHYKYFTMNSWNGLRSIANNVKLYNLELDGDCDELLDYIFSEYENDLVVVINEVIEDFEANHKGYKVGFNGQNCGYLVLYNEGNMRSILPDYFDYESYEDWIATLKDYNETVNWYKDELRSLTKLVRDFDLLCDELRVILNNFLQTL